MDKLCLSEYLNVFGRISKKFLGVSNLDSKLININPVLLSYYLSDLALNKEDSEAVNICFEIIPENVPVKLYFDCEKYLDYVPKKDYENEELEFIMSAIERLNMLTVSDSKTGDDMYIFNNSRRDDKDKSKYKLSFHLIHKTKCVSSNSLIKQIFKTNNEDCLFDNSVYNKNQKFRLPYHSKTDLKDRTQLYRVCITQNEDGEYEFANYDIEEIKNLDENLSHYVITNIYNMPEGHEMDHMDIVITPKEGGVKFENVPEIKYDIEDIKTIVDTCCSDMLQDGYREDYLKLMFCLGNMNNNILKGPIYDIAIDFAKLRSVTRGKPFNLKKFVDKFSKGRLCANYLMCIAKRALYTLEDEEQKEKIRAIVNKYCPKVEEKIEYMDASEEYIKKIEKFEQDAIIEAKQNKDAKEEKRNLEIEQEKHIYKNTALLTNVLVLTGCFDNKRLYDDKFLRKMFRMFGKMGRENNRENEFQKLAIDLNENNTCKLTVTEIMDEMKNDKEEPMLFMDFIRLVNENASNLTVRKLAEYKRVFKNLSIRDPTKPLTMQDKVNTIVDKLEFENQYQNIHGLKLDCTNLEACIKFIVGNSVNTKFNGEWFYRYSDKPSVSTQSKKACFNDDSNHLNYQDEDGKNYSFYYILKEYLLSNVKVRRFIEYDIAYVIPYLKREIKQYDKIMDKEISKLKFGMRRIHNLFTPFTYDNPNIDITGYKGGLLVEHFYNTMTKEEALFMVKIMAYRVQNPRDPVGVLVYLCGKTRTGKSKSIDICGLVMSPYSYNCGSHFNFADKFNDELRDQLFVSIDESGDHGSGGFNNVDLTKSVLVAPTFNFEGKGKQKQTLINRVFVMASTNNPHTIKLNEQTAERFAVLYMNDSKKGDLEYFKRLADIQHDPEELQRLFKWLSQYDITGFYPQRDIPKTALNKEIREINQSNHVSHLKAWFEAHYKPSIIEKEKYSKEEKKALSDEDAKKAFIEWRNDNFIRPDDLYNDYLLFCGRTTPYKKNKWLALMRAVNLESKTYKIYGKSQDGFVMNLQRVKEGVKIEYGVEFDVKIEGLQDEDEEDEEIDYNC